MINMKLERITELRAKLEQDLLAVICAFEKETEMIPISIDFDFAHNDQEMILAEGVVFPYSNSNNKKITKVRVGILI